MNRPTDNFDQLPDSIVERLRARDRALAVLTPEADRAVRRAATDQFSQRRSRRRVRRWYLPATGVAAAAAVAVIAIVVTRPFEADRGSVAPAPRAQVVADDIDASGRVDILDAFALARAREADPDAATQARIDMLASRVVSLSEGVL
jgi:hypothetical protein